MRRELGPDAPYLAAYASPAKKDSKLPETVEEHVVPDPPKIDDPEQD